MPDRTHILAIETSNPSSGAAGVALGTLRAAGADLLSTEPLRDLGRHNDDLLPAIDRLCRRHGVAPADLAKIAVSVGPGGYTAVRIAVAAAKMIARAVGASCIAVPSALVAAWPRVSTNSDAIAVALASKDTGPPPNGGTAWACVLKPGSADLAAQARAGRIIGPADIPALGVTTMIADKFLPAAMRAAAADANIHTFEPTFDPATCLAIACSGLLPHITPADLLPLYPREPDAVTLWKVRQSGKSGKSP